MQGIRRLGIREIGVVRDEQHREPSRSPHISQRTRMRDALDLWPTVILPPGIVE